jgi:23S rRNA (uracil1939-C5)-methyltransferase
MELQQELKFRFEIQDLPSYSDSFPHLLVSVYDADDTSIQMDGLIERFQTIPMVAWAGSSRRLHESPFFHFETDLGIQFHTAAGLFQQINISHNHTVRRLVLDTIKHYASKRVLDVFCGSGNLSLPLARDVQHIDGVEFSKRAIATAQHNTAVGGIKNANYYAGDTEKFLWRAAKQGVRYDMIIADPPREGMYKCLIPLMKLNPEVIIYVSCDPATLSRDLSSLCRQNYRIRRFVALDFFPNTYHIESFVVLEKGP